MIVPETAASPFIMLIGRGPGGSDPYRSDIEGLSLRWTINIKIPEKPFKPYLDCIKQNNNSPLIKKYILMCLDVSQNPKLNIDVYYVFLRTQCL